MSVVISDGVVAMSARFASSSSCSPSEILSKSSQ
ncbi:hypothetical protein A2U01_0066296, partial [Trifolium medium]|nr:hypothetical protein [Trifolium medium]